MKARRKLARVLRAVRARGRSRLWAGLDLAAIVARAVAFAPTLPPVAFAVAASWETEPVRPAAAADAPRMLAQLAGFVVLHDRGELYGGRPWRRKAQRAAAAQWRAAITRG